MSGDKYLRMLTEDKSSWNVDIDGTPLHVGERIIVVGPVSRKGDKGRIEEVINGFCVVDFGGTSASYQCSDVRLISDMEDVDDEDEKQEDDGYDEPGDYWTDPAGGRHRKQGPGEEFVDPTKKYESKKTHGKKLTEATLEQSDAFWEISEELNDEVMPDEIEAIWKGSLKGLPLEDIMSDLPAVTNKDVLAVQDKLREKGLLSEALDLTTVDFSKDVAALKKYFAATPERRDGFKFDPNSGVAVVKTEEQHANFPQDVKNAIRNLVTKGVDVRFSMFEAKRLSDVETKWEPKEGFFKQSAEKIAKGLKRASKDKRQATSRLTFYINRAGKNLSAKDKKRLENAKDILHGLYEEKEAPNENSWDYSDVTKKVRDEKYVNVIYKTLNDMDEKGAEKAFADACEDENYYGQRPDIVKDRQKMMSILRTLFDVTIERDLTESLKEAKEDIEFKTDEKVFTVKIEKTSVGSFFFIADTRNAGEAVGRVLRDESVEFVPYKKDGKFELHLNVQDFNRDQDVRKLITKLKKRATEWLIAIESGENIKKVADEAESIGNPGDIKKSLDSAVKSTKVKIDFVWPEGTVKPKPDIDEDEAPAADEKEKIDDLKDELKESKGKKKSKTLKEADYGESFVVIEPIVDLMKGIEEKAKKHGVIFDTMEGDQSSKWKVFGKVAALESFLMDALSKSREEARQMIMDKGALHEDAGDERAAFEKENKELTERVRDWLDSMQKHYETYEYDDTDFESEFGEDADQALNIAIEENWVDVITRPGQANEYVAVDSELIEDATDIGAPTAEDVKKAKSAMNESEDDERDTYGMDASEIVMYGSKGYLGYLDECDKIAKDIMLPEYKAKGADYYRRDEDNNPRAEDPTPQEIAEEILADVDEEDIAGYEESDLINSFVKLLKKS